MTGNEVRQTIQPRSGSTFKAMVRSLYFILNAVGNAGKFQKGMTFCDHIVKRSFWCCVRTDWKVAGIEDPKTS